MSSSHIPNFPYTRDARLKTRYQVIFLFLETKNRTFVAKTTGVSRRLVNEWVTTYLSEGLEALNIKKQAGRPSALTDNQKCQLKQYVCSHAVKVDGGRLIGEDIKEYISDTFDIYYKLNNVYRLMHELNLSWITSRSKHPKQSEEAQEAFKKFPIENDHQNSRARGA